MSVFFALDVETANLDRSSICQIGLVLFKNGREELAWSTLIDPKCEFDPYNISIHGIGPEDVKGHPTYSDIHDVISEMVRGQVLVHHSSFDKTAFHRCFANYAKEPFGCEWLDNTAVVRRVWKEFAKKGYNLKNLSKVFEIPLDHHDALSDARAAGEIFAKALYKTNTSPEEWLTKVCGPITPKTSSANFESNSEGVFFEESIVFTGTLQEERKLCQQRAAEVGFTVQDNVTKKTSYLCVGIQDPTVLAGHSKSSKHRKAEKYQSAGQDIAIISEEDFWGMIHSGISS